MPVRDPRSGAPVVRAVCQYLVRPELKPFQAPAYVWRMVQVMPQHLERAV